MQKNDSPRRSGIIPPSRRRLVALLCLAMAVVLAVVFLSISLATGGEVHWARLIIAAAFVLGLFGFYLWIRFSD